MVYDTLVQLIKKQFYVVFQETFRGSENEQFMDRFIGKHPLLKPEIMVVDDQPYGFKHISKNVLGLENFPIYVELEYERYDDFVHLHSIDLYSEINLKSSHVIESLTLLLELHSKTVYVDHIKRLNKPDVELLYVYSRIGEIFNDTNVDDDIEDGLLTLEELKVMIDIQLTSFLNFIKFTDDLITKNVDIKDILQVSKEILNGRNFKQ